MFKWGYTVQFQRFLFFLILAAHLVGFTVRSAAGQIDQHKDKKTWNKPAGYPADTFLCFHMLLYYLNLNTISEMFMLNLQMERSLSKRG